MDGATEQLQKHLLYTAEVGDFKTDDGASRAAVRASILYQLSEPLEQLSEPLYCISYRSL